MQMCTYQSMTLRQDRLNKSAKQEETKETSKQEETW